MRASLTSIRPMNMTLINPMRHCPQRTRRWRQLADWTADAIVISHDSEGADAQSIHRILQLWVVRIQCLRKLAGPGAKGILAHETDNLLECLPPFYPNPIPPYNAKERFFNSFIPFELILTYALLPVHLFAEGPPLDGHLVLQRLQDILVGCKHEYWRTQDGIWVERIRRVGICMANVLVRMQEWEQATSVLQGLRSNEGAGGGSNQGAREVQEALLLVYLEQSRLEEAAELLQTMDDKALDGDEARQRRKATVDRLRILLLTAQGLPDEAESLSEQVYDRRRTDVSERALGDACNLAACRLYAGKTAEVRPKICYTWATRKERKRKMFHDLGI